MNERIDYWRDNFLHAVAQTSSHHDVMGPTLALGQLLQRGQTWPHADTYLFELEQSARRRARHYIRHDPVAGVEAIFEMLCDEGFYGDRENYGEVANSFMDRVLERRRGLPITLSILAIHLAQRVGIDLVGISFPGHFIVGLDLDTATPSIFDPFDEGRRLGFTDLAVMYQAVSRQRLMSDGRTLRRACRPATAHQVVTRILRNLQHHYARWGSHDKVAEVDGLLAALSPEVRELDMRRGFVLGTLELN